MFRADVFAFPSIREQGGGVLTMASMSCTPSIVVDYGGPSYRVPEGCGIKVPLGSTESITCAFTEALECLFQSPETVRRMGIAARRFTEKYYSWSWKAKKTAEIYQWVLGERSEKPQYWAE
jgi:glycosyltransferase involved in cell wall biosynthesis